MSALEIACWDIIGKAAGKPCYELLGGRVHEALRSYTYLYPRPGDRAHVYHDADMAAERAAEEVARGFTAVKFDPAGPYTAMGGHQPRLVDIERSVTFLRTIREAVGGQADLLVGTHGQFTAGRGDPIRPPHRAVRPAVVRGAGAARRHPRRWRRLRRSRRCRSRPASG